tara:strand:+ start:3863 stop:4582 length:720 start_codon:yes stop_codon:yes gene_type:complete
MLRNLRKIYSPNFEIKKRKKSEIKSIILHYTGMKNEKTALNKLTNFNSRVSCHYFITYSGEIINLVPDLYISWHAGKSKWRKIKSLNNNSIGIEIANQGHNIKYENFKKEQIKSILFLVSNLKKKYSIKKSNILGHSDISPDRKKDPGEKFPWKLMYEKKLSIWHNIKNTILRKSRNKKCTENEKKNFFKNLREIGYNSNNKILLIKAFQRRFRQGLINGKVDKECLFISISIKKINKD